jgi:hypothetical protein
MWMKTQRERNKWLSDQEWRKSLITERKEKIYARSSYVIFLFTRRNATSIRTCKIVFICYLDECF